MTRNVLLGPQVKRLLSNLSEHGVQHLAEIETDLVQTNILLGEAIEKLGASFMAIHQAVTAQREVTEQILSGADSTPEIGDRLRAAAGEVERHVVAAVTGLQFQDMTSQLIGCTVRRVAGLSAVLGGMGSSGAALDAEIEAHNIVAALNGINKMLEEQSAKLDGELWKAVRQTHMESGDIELF
jgi:hypothetical protein